MTASIRALRRLRSGSSLDAGGHDLGGSLRGTRGVSVTGSRGIQPWRAVCSLGVAATLILSACSNSEQADETTSTSITSTTTSTSTTTPPTPSTEVDVSTSPTSSTTPIVEVDAETAIRAALATSFADFSDCLTSVPQCDPSILEATRAGALLDANRARIEEWNSAGYTVIDRDQYRYVIESVELGADGTTATATVCLADGSKLVLPGAGPQGADVIIDDQFVSGREAWELRLDADGQWRAYSAPVVGVTEESDVCPSA